MSAIANSNQPEEKPKTSRVKAYWRNIPWKKLSSLVMAIALCFYLTACGGDKSVSNAPDPKVAIINITEVSPPTEIQRLSRLLDSYAPQVSIVSPKPDELLNDTQVSVKIDVKNLPIFKNADFGLGPHIHVTMDNQEYKALYDLSQPVTFDHLNAGTHTIRAFASRPWHESFKNQGAYAQTTFNILTKTGENTPEAKTPLLTYSRPVGTYGAEPIMLDFYLQNAPLHLLGKDDEVIDDWQVRATIDGQSFTFDRWEPIYLKGFKTGQNWVKLELLEPDGDAIANVFNSTAHLINYQPNGTDTLSRLVSGEKIADIDAIVNPDYVPPAPEVIPTPIESVSPEPAVTPATKPIEAPKPEVNNNNPISTPKEEAKPTDKDTKSTNVIPVPVVPVPVAPVAPIITEPVKTSPAPIRSKYAPVAIPTKQPIAPKVVTPPVTPQETTKDKDTTQVMPKAKPARDVVPEKQPKPNVFKPTAAQKIESKATDLKKNTKSTPETKPESKSTDSPPPLTDLSTTTSTPIKVLNSKN